MKIQVGNPLITGILLLILVLIGILIINKNEGFQSYDKRQNLEDIRYFISLGLNPEYNDSYRNALADYQANNGVDYFSSEDVNSRSSTDIPINDSSADLDQRTF